MSGGEKPKRRPQTPEQRAACSARSLARFHNQTPEQRAKVNARRRAHRVANHDVVLAKEKAYVESHREGIRARQRAWEKANPEHIREQNRIYREKNREQLKERSRAWYVANRDKALGQHKAYVAANRAAVNAKGLKWRKDNPEKVRATGRRRVEGLHIAYVAARLGIPQKNIPKDLLEAKREQLLTYRAIRQLEKAAKEKP